MDKKIILVTGGSGFMGSHITEALVKTKQYKVYAVDDHSGGSPQNIPQDCYFHNLDLRDRKKTYNFIERTKPDIIYSLAANAREGASFFQPLSVTERNMNVYMNVLEPAIKSGLEKVIYFSSMAVYGEQVPPFGEELGTAPCDVYGLSKDWCEKATKMLAEAHGFRYTVIRPHNVFGEKQCLSDVYRNVIAIFMNRIMREEPIYIYGDGEQKRAFSYIDFSLPCYLKCLDDSTDGQVYNIGGTVNITINEVAKMVIENFPEYKTPEVIHLADRHGEVKYAWSTYEKSIEELGYKETFDIEEGIRRMSAWAKEQGPQDWTEEKLNLINEKVPTTWTMERNQKKESEALHD
jgi:UDP-glucose 4-epimerase